jgi:hypothetical protein
LDNDTILLNVERDYRADQLLIVLFAAAVIILALIGASSGEINFVSNLFVSAIVGAMFSLVAATIVEGFTGDMLKRILITIEYHDLRFSVSLFVIATIIVKYTLLR